MNRTLTVSAVLGTISGVLSSLVAINVADKGVGLSSANASASEPASNGRPGSRHDGERCMSSEDCVTHVCTKGVCGCSSGFSFCGREKACLPPCLCCQDSDCTQPPNSCYVSDGARCDSGVCHYRTLSCSSPVSACYDGKCTDSPLVFRVEATHTVKPLSETAAFRATLTNVSKSTIAVSAYGLTNVVVEYVRKGNEDLHGSTSSIKYYKSPGTIAGQKLRPLSAGETVSFPLSLSDMPPGSCLLTRTFVMPKAGRYVAKFSYQYTGNDRGRDNVFHGLVHSTEVNFDVE